MVIVLGQTVIVAGVSVLVWLFFPTDWLALRGPIGLVMAAFAVLFPMRMFGAILEGLQEQTFVIRANLFAWGIGTFANIVAVLAGLGLYALAIGWVLSQAFTAGACSFRIYRHYREILPSRFPSISFSELRPQLGRGFWVSASQLTQVMLGGFDVLIIGKVLGPASVVPYSCTGKLASVLSNQPVMLMHLAVPALSELKAEGSKERTYQTMTCLGQGMMLLSGAVFCVVLAVNQGFVRAWVGPDRYVGFTITFLMLAEKLLRHLSLTFAYAIFCFGYERRMAISALLDGVVTTSAIATLTPLLGYRGAVVGSILGVCFVSLPVTMVTLARELQVHVASLVSPLLPWLWRFAILVVASSVFARICNPQTFAQTVALGGLITVGYGAVLLPAAMRMGIGPYLRSALIHFQGVIKGSSFNTVSARLQSVGVSSDEPDNEGR
jgi:O-antigen/teichoic acid export membrane protein